VQACKQQPTAFPGLLQQYCPTGQGAPSNWKQAQFPFTQLGAFPPGGQVPPGQVQAPLTHAPPPVQLFPHMPQFCASTSSEVQAGWGAASQHMSPSVPSQLVVVVPQ
jgi:hypothetical protein